MLIYLKILILFNRKEKLQVVAVFVRYPKCQVGFWYKEVFFFFFSKENFIHIDKIELNNEKNNFFCGLTNTSQKYCLLYNLKQIYQNIKS